jgi:anaerobic ribonucleoside-triphosphate reductase activating protein
MGFSFLKGVCMNYGTIKTYDIANGEGVRTTLFVSGCRNACPGCFQPETWNFDYGKPFDRAARQSVLDSLRPDFIAGLTLLGGEPFEPENQRDLVPFLKEVRAQFPNKTIWAFTGYVLDQDLLEGGRKHCEATNEMLSFIDVLVDGPFRQELKNISLQFRGSSNQRIIDLKRSLEVRDIVLYLP